MSTHIGAEPGQIAPRVLLPGDPLRAKWIAENFLTDVTCYSTVRNMLGFTGVFEDEQVSVQGTGMGQPSLAIYVHELITSYGARALVRVGSCGALTGRLGLRDVVLAMAASTDSAMNRLRFDGVDYAPTADFALLRSAHDMAAQLGQPVHVGPVASVDSFYSDRPELVSRLAEYGVLAVEMETAALYTLAAKHGVSALALLTVSDSLVSGEATSAQEREQTFSAMVEIALRTIVAAPLPAPPVV
jgi:purine-nucleoside phosphorylase